MKCTCSDCGHVFDAEPVATHRLACMDSRDKASWAEAMRDDRANVIFTSPPYASQRKYDESSGFKPVAPDAYSEWWRPLQENVAEYLAVDGSFFVNVKEHCEDGQRHLYVKDLVISMVREWGWKFVDEFCWRDKKNGVPGGWNNRFKDAWEPVFHFAREGKIKFRPEAVSCESESCFDYHHATPTTATGSGLKGAPVGGERVGMARPSNVLEIAASGGSDHSAAFPCALPEFFILAFSDPGDLVVDPFMGSGTTLVAAAKLERRSIGFEISSGYTDVVRRRWSAFAKAAGIAAGPGGLE